jgi:hypothetical protein
LWGLLNVFKIYIVLLVPIRPSKDGELTFFLKSKPSYDANGNIVDLHRNGIRSIVTAMKEIDYQYDVMDKLINNPQNRKDFVLDELINSSDNIHIQFSKEVSNEFLRNLNDRVLKFNKRISLRFFSYDGLWKDLSFLEHLKNITNLIIDEPLLDNVQQICLLDDLHDLTIGYTKKKVDVYCLSELNLKFFSIEGNQENLINLLQNIDLKGLLLWNMKIKDLSAIEHMSLEYLNINNLKVDSLEVIGKLNGIKVFYLSGMSGINDLTFISNLINIENIHLSNLKNCTTLFDFSKLNNLSRLSLENLPKLESLDNIEASKKLEELYIYNCRKICDNDLYNLKKRNLRKIELE